MNAKQLLLGLSILVPAVCGARPHLRIPVETIKAPNSICVIKTLGKDIKSGVSVIWVNDICYKVEYRSNVGLVFAWVDTLYGPFFGFSIPTTLYDYQNDLPKAFKDLFRRQMRQYPGLLGIGNFWKIPELP